MIEVIGNHTRTEILRLLAVRRMTTVELAEVLEVAHSSIHRNLALLETHGLVTASVEAAARRRGNKDVTWTTNQAKVAELGAQWIAYATSRD